MTFAFLAVLSDWIAVIIGLVAAFLLRFHSGLLGVPHGIPVLETYLFGFIFTASGWVLIFAFLRLYDPRRGLTAADEFFLVLRGALLGSLFVMSAAFLYRDISYSRLFLVIAVPNCCVVVLLMRAALRRMRVCCRRRGIGVQPVLFVGGGSLIDGLRRRMESRPDLGYRITGAVSEPDIPVPEGIRNLGGMEEVADICLREGIVRVFIALPETRRHRIAEVLRACENLPLDFEIVPDLVATLSERVRITEMDGIPLLAVKEYPLEAWNRFLKRTFDIAGVVLISIALLPLMLLLAAVIRVDSSGPAFYRQRRIGRDGRIFDIFKFRSMVMDAEKTTGPIWAEQGDKRCTRVGAFLRRTSLDELPQLWNVLRGEMSLVGPRPERPFFVQRFQKDVPRYFDRHRVKSGMTGWAQVNGLRGNTSIEERTKCDVYYVENWSIFFDMKILCLTFRHLATR